MENNGITAENYEEKRAELVKLNSNTLGVVIREKEQLLDKYLSELKTDFFKKFSAQDVCTACLIGREDIVNSKLYKFCSRLPKGADLHVHDMALLPAGELIILLSGRTDFYINGDRKSFDLKYVKSGETAPEGYIRFDKAISEGYYNTGELIDNWTVKGTQKSGLNIWDWFEELFCRHGDMSDNPVFARDYYEYTFTYYCKKNIMHVEIHLMLTEDLEKSAEFVKAVREAYYAVKKKYPYFTVRIIGAGVKADRDNFEYTKNCFLNASFVQETVKDESGETPENFIIGFDLVNEEDTSMPLKDFAPLLLKVKKQYKDMKFYIHGGESIDAKNDNLIDAYLLGVSRVGHGLNLYRFPDLHSRYVRSEICLEVCPVSNMSLGYTKDIRNHPATEYLKSGMAISLCSDDAVYMENETLTDDFFMGIVGWDLKVAELKQLGINSIMYSGLENERKFEAIRNYNRLWNEFVDETVGEN